MSIIDNLTLIMNHIKEAKRSLYLAEQEYSKLVHKIKASEYKPRTREQLVSGEGVDDLDKKHPCHCYHEREWVGKTITSHDGVKEHKYVQEDPGYCGQCEGTGWCY